jgi:hypothetical protein
MMTVQKWDPDKITYRTLVNTELKNWIGCMHIIQTGISFCI